MEVLFTLVLLPISTTRQREYASYTIYAVHLTTTGKFVQIKIHKLRTASNQPSIVIVNEFLKLLVVKMRQVLMGKERVIILLVVNGTHIPVMESV